MSMETWLVIRLVLSLINLCILGYFIYVFGRKQIVFHSKFTLGFLIFAIALFVRTFFASPILAVVFGVTEEPYTDPYRLIADLFELAALLTLLYILER